MVSVRLRDVACARGGHEIFRNVCAHLGSGGALVLCGANGCGKTSLLRILAGLLEPSRGEVIMQGKGALPCFLGHENALKKGMTAEANLLFWSVFLGAAKKDLVRGIEYFRLQDLLQTQVSHLSSGQLRRLALARLCLTDAPLWLLDEPASGLDRQALDCLGHVLSAHRAGGGMVVAATHIDLPLTDVELLQLDEERFCSYPEEDRVE